MINEVLSKWIFSDFYPKPYKLHRFPMVERILFYTLFYTSHIDGIDD